MIQRIAKTHPKTGRPIRPLFIDKHGRARYPIMGAAEDDDNGSGSNSDDNASGEGSDGKDGSGGSGSEDQDGKDSKDGGDSDLKKQIDSLTERMKAADRRASEAEKKVKEFEDKDKSDLEKAQGDLEAANKTIESLTEANKSLRLENAFAMSKGPTWNDPSLVFDLVRKRDDVTIDDDGNVKGMTEALKAIAKDKPYLVKEGDGDDGPPRSGSNTGSGSGKDRDSAVKKKASKFRV